MNTVTKNNLELEYDKKHKRGRRTFFFLFLRHSWWLTLIGVGVLWLAGSMYVGKLHDPAKRFFSSHENWYISVDLFSLWLVLVGVSFLFVAYLIASVYYRHYKFLLDRHAVHLHHGLFFIRETTIPYHQITNVHIARPYHYRMFGVAQLDIVTAADQSVMRIETKATKFLLPVIDMPVARALSRQILENAAKIRKGKHAYDPLDDEDGVIITEDSALDTVAPEEDESEDEDS